MLAWMQLQTGLSLASGVQAEIMALVVAADVRGQGIGTALLHYAGDWALTHGVSALRVRSNLARTESHRFYLGQGFQCVKSQAVYQKNLAV